MVRERERYITSPTAAASCLRPPPLAPRPALPAPRPPPFSARPPLHSRAGAEPSVRPIRPAPSRALPHHGPRSPVRTARRAAVRAAPAAGAPQPAARPRGLTRRRSLSVRPPGRPGRMKPVRLAECHATHGGYRGGLSLRKKVGKAGRPPERGGGSRR